MSAFTCRSDDENSTTTTTTMMTTTMAAAVSFNNGWFSSAFNGTTATLHMPVKREDEDSSCTDDSASSMDWKSSSKSLKIGERAVDYSVTSPSYCSTDSTMANSSLATSGVQKPTGSKRNGKGEKLSPEEEERRQLRREKNKVAAAKCRQKRVDLTNQLLHETRILEEEQSRLKETIKSYQQEKEELELVLDAHRAHCGAPVQRVPAAVQEAKIDSGKSEELGSSEFVNSNAVMSSSAISRPNRIPGTAKLLSSPMSEASIVRTPVLPSSGFVLGLQSMINGHTGLTPLTEMIPTSESFLAEEGKVSSFGLPSYSKLTTL